MSGIQGGGFILVSVDKSWRFLESFKLILGQDNTEAMNNVIVRVDQPFQASVGNYRINNGRIPLVVGGKCQWHMERDIANLKRCRTVSNIGDSPHKCLIHSFCCFTGSVQKNKRRIHIIMWGGIINEPGIKSTVWINLSCSHGKRGGNSLFQARIFYRILGVIVRAMDVPEIMLKVRDDISISISTPTRVDIREVGIQAARTNVPGAITSGFKIPGKLGEGPLEVPKLPENQRSIEPAADVKTQGIPLCNLPIPCPAFPAEAETRTFLSIAPNEAMAMGSSYKGTKSNPIEIEITSTPSAIA
nr:hypothetical protein VIGAN_05131200 [Ipomoea batatas]